MAKHLYYCRPNKLNLEIERYKIVYECKGFIVVSKGNGNRPLVLEPREITPLTSEHGKRILINMLEPSNCNRYSSIWFDENPFDAARDFIDKTEAIRKEYRLRKTVNDAQEAFKKAQLDLKNAEAGVKRAEEYLKTMSAKAEAVALETITIKFKDIEDEK